MWIYIIVIGLILLFPYLPSIESFTNTDPYTLGEIQKGRLNKYIKDIDKILSEVPRIDKIEDEVDKLSEQTSEFQNVSSDNDPTKNYSSSTI